MEKWKPFEWLDSDCRRELVLELDGVISNIREFLNHNAMGVIRSGEWTYDKWEYHLFHLNRALKNLKLSEEEMLHSGDGEKFELFWWKYNDLIDLAMYDLGQMNVSYNNYENAKKVFTTSNREPSTRHLLYGITRACHRYLSDITNRIHVTPVELMADYCRGGEEE